MTLVFGIALVDVPGTSAASTSTPSRGTGPATTQTTLSAARPSTPTRLPVRFERNVGQAPAPFDFVSKGHGAVVGLAATGMTVTFIPPASGPASGARAPSSEISLRLLGGSPSVRAKPGPTLPTKTNYLVGQDKSAWRTDVPAFASVTYPGVYPGVDVTYGDEGGATAYRFDVAPYTDPAVIRLSVAGSRSVSVDSDGALVIQAGATTVRHPHPSAFQGAGDARRPVSVRYVVESPGVVGFAVGARADNAPLTIDPEVTYSTLFGGNEDGVTAMAVDAAGRQYLTGTGAVWLGSGYVNGIYVDRLHADGVTVDYSTWIVSRVGGDSAAGVAADAAGEAVLIGTAQPDFPVTAGSFRPVAAQPTDAFVAKLTSDGSGLVYGSWIGTGSNGSTTVPWGVATDTAGYAYVVGMMRGDAVPPTAGAYVSPRRAGDDAFAMKVAPSGSSLVYSSVIGGSDVDAATAMTVRDGRLLMTGQTSSHDLPVTPNAPQPVAPDPSGTSTGDGFVTELDATGGSVVFSTYLGGTGRDVPQAMTADGAGNVYVAGITLSADFPTTAGVLQPRMFAGDYGEAFVTKMSTITGAVGFSTYIGGPLPSGLLTNPDVHAIALDPTGDPVIAGTTPGAWPTTSDAVKRALTGSSDAFLTTLDTTGRSVVYSTLIGGSGADYAAGVAIDGVGGMYVAGGTLLPAGALESDFPVTDANRIVTSDRQASSALPFVMKYDLGADPVNNGRFDWGGLAGWTPHGAVNLANAGTEAVDLGAFDTAGDSSVTQSFIVPSAGGVMTVDYMMICRDPNHDYATAVLTDVDDGSTLTVVPRVCASDVTWRQAETDLTNHAGHHVTLSLLDHAALASANQGTEALFDNIVFRATSPPSHPSPPSPPSAVTAVAGTNSATVSWRPPVTAGGSPITGYVITDGNRLVFARVPAGTTTTTINGLSDQTGWAFTVTAVNAVGRSPWSAVSLAVYPHPATVVPSEPLGVLATAGDRSATVSWVAPTWDGGSPITAYVVTSEPGGISTTVNGSARSAVVAGLTNGVGYVFTVQAVNTNGTSPESVPSAVVTPAPPSVIANGGFESGLAAWSTTGSTSTTAGPVHGGSLAALIGAPTPTSGDSTLSQSFVVPPAGGQLSLWYQVRCPDTLQYDWATVVLRDLDTGTSMSVLPRTCTNDATWRQATASLSAAAGHHVSLVLTSHDDDYAGDATSTVIDDVVVSAPGAPSAPTSVIAIPGDRSAHVSWAPSGSDGGSPITGYRVTSTPGAATATTTADATGVTVSGLTNGTTYTFTVTAANAVATSPPSAPSTPVVPSAPSSGALTNGGFENGLTGWHATGTVATSATAHSGSLAAVLGSASPTSGDSSISQSFTVPANGGQLSFWYLTKCPDTVQYDWATATLSDQTTGAVTTILPRTCTNTGGWAQRWLDVGPYAGHSVTLTLTSHDDDYAGDATATEFDDVELAAAPPPASGLTNGGFENGLNGWQASGAAATTSTAHTGTSAALVGTTSPTLGDSSVTQTFTVPPSATQLSLWYLIRCPDTVQYDWATVTLYDHTTGATSTVLPRTCNNDGSWTQRWVSIAANAGHTVTLTLTSHDDDYAGDATQTLFDDVGLR